MGWQPKSEKDDERKLLTDFANKFKFPIVKLQSDIDDGKTDGIVEISGKHECVEARRKGYPNHHGETCNFANGWDAWFLVKEGIFLNECTIENYKDSKFIFIVNIKTSTGSESRVACIRQDRVKELLGQPYQWQISTNSGKKQSVKSVPHKWFKKY